MSSTKRSSRKGKPWTKEMKDKAAATRAAKAAQGEIPLADIPDDKPKGKRKPYTKKQDPRMAAVVQMLRFAAIMLEDM